MTSKNQNFWLNGAQAVGVPSNDERVYSMLKDAAQHLLTQIRTRTRKYRRLRRRRSIAMAYYNAKLAIINSWIWKDTETSNFYYKLTATNLDHLAQLISSVTNEQYSRVVEYFEELETDIDLRRHLEQELQTSQYGQDIQIEYGRRLGWYAFVRVLKPSTVVETGVDHGVGSCVLASALLRNAAEGYAGRYYGTEIRQEAGKLFSGKYSETGKIIYDDSITTLEGLDAKIDLFINDSDHSADYEYREYLTIAEKLSVSAVILGDNSHATDSLSRFSREKKRKFVFFGEEPKDHWYPGAGIGVSYR